MILLLGGTSETPQIANLLAENSYKVLISNLTETGTAWDLGNGISLRHGALDTNGMAKLIREKDIAAIVDASHPYAEELHATAMKVSSRLDIPYYRYDRPGINYADYDISFADNHQQSALLAFKIGHCALLTTGTKNLTPYVTAAHQTNSKLYVRILPCQESMNICKKNAIDNKYIISEQGPFTVQQNIKMLQKYFVDVLVTKDSGIEGGVIQKLEAAKQTETKVVVVKRPLINQSTGKRFNKISSLIKTIKSDLSMQQNIQL